MTYQAELQTIGKGIAEGEIAQDRIAAALSRFYVVTDLDQAAGMPPGRIPVWPALPTERLGRHKEYSPAPLSLLWRKDRATGQYQGPYGAHTLTVGSDPARQALAREVVRNTYHWLQLTYARAQLQEWLDIRLISVKGQAGNAYNWRSCVPDIPLPEPDLQG